MKAVMYGGGNIGRGFIGALLSQSGYEVTFIDVSRPVVDTLRTNHEYSVRYVSSKGSYDVAITNVTAIDGNDSEAVANAIAECDVMATAVGARILKAISHNIVAGIRKRWERGGKELNIIICENLMDANKVLEDMLKKELTPKEQKMLDKTVGLVEASIGRMVPVQTDQMKDGDPLRVCVEHYGFLPVDKAAFKGEVPAIKNLVPFEPFDFYIKRKLYIHNMGHAVCAYLGDLLHYEYIWQAIDVVEVRNIVQNAMTESALALCRKYNMEFDGVVLHITDLLQRFTNAALNDTCNRVGQDPARKLSPDDRLIGSISLAFSQGIVPAYIAVGAAAGIRRYIIQSDSMVQSVDCAQQVLQSVSGLAPDSKEARLILDMYKLILEGKSLGSIRRAADAIKAESLGDVI
ncbi:MAG: mannitol dehydrogenase [Clostridia bacterium]|nr:mannitol dehydrogenase [Clostridia bacterium]